MNLDERINKNIRKMEERKKLPPSEDEEETYTYASYKPVKYLNEDKQGVFESKMQSGINTVKSVFDRSTFNTGHDN